jgi:hypothetical protein
MPIKPEPQRLNRSAWRAVWPRDGQTHYIGHNTWIEVASDKTGLIYCDRWPGEFKETERTLLSVDDLRRTSIILIQVDDPDFAFRRWHSAWTIADLEVRGQDERGRFWIKCRLVKNISEPD